ncbi:hypothetical protein D3C78_1115760 [compost metagenome]
MRTVRDAIQHLGSNRTRRHRIDSHIVLAGFKRYRLGEPFDSMFAGHIHRCVRIASAAHSGGQVYDGSRLLLRHDAHFMLQAQERSERIGVERGGIRIHCLLHDRTPCAFKACAVDGNIQTTKARNAEIHKLGHLFFVAHIRLNEFGLRTHGLQLRYQLSSCNCIASRNDQMRAITRKSNGRGVANASRCTCDQYNLIFKLLIHGGVRSWSGLVVNKGPSQKFAV